MKAGNSFTPSSFNLKAATPAAAEAARSRAETVLHAQDEAYAPFASAAADRLVQALSLLELDAVLNAFPTAPTAVRKHASFTPA